MISSNDIATKNFVQNNQNITDNTILKGIGSNIRYIDYNNITKNKLSFNSPLFINGSNSVSINTNLLGWVIDITSNNIYTYNGNYNLGIGNTNPLAYLHIGNYIDDTNEYNNNPDTSLIISKINDKNINKNFKIGIDNDFNLSIGHFYIDKTCNLNNIFYIILCLINIKRFLLIIIINYN